MSDDEAPLTMTGYHGCDAANVGGIRAENFRCSTGDHHWLGEGVYFFGEGFSDPAEDAKRWAIAESWDNLKQARRYNRFSVLAAVIAPQNPLDMTQDPGKAKVNYARTELTKRMRPKAGYDDSQIVRWLASNFGHDVLVQDFFIQMTRERRLKIRSRFPNVRVICVRDPKSTIDKGSIRVTYTGLVPSNPQ